MTAEVVVDKVVGGAAEDPADFTEHAPHRRISPPITIFNVLLMVESITPADGE